LRTILVFLTAVMLNISMSYAQYFPKPPGNVPIDDFKAKWYSTQLRALKEPSFFILAKNPASNSYRFLWLRTFHHPVAIRVDHQQSNDSWILTVKVASGAGGYSPGTITTNTSRKLTAQEAESLVSKVESGGFWNAPDPVDEPTGEDGSQWIIEGAKAGHYHVVDRWMPKNGPAHDLGLFFAFDLAKLSIPKSDIY
jgi:hypothetical protein